MSEAAKTPKKLSRDAYYKDGIRALILLSLDELPTTFSIIYVTKHLADKAEKPFSKDEMSGLTDRIRRAMRTWNKCGKVEIHQERTESNNLLTHYTKK